MVPNFTSATLGPCQHFLVIKQAIIDTRPCPLLSEVTLCINVFVLVVESVQDYYLIPGTQSQQPLTVIILCFFPILSYHLCA